MDGNSDFVKVEKLQSADDWPAWKFEFRVLLNAAEVMEVVSGKEKQPVRGDSQSEAEHEAALLKWNKSDRKAQNGTGEATENPCVEL